MAKHSAANRSIDRPKSVDVSRDVYYLKFYILTKVLVGISFFKNEIMLQRFSRKEQLRFDPQVRHFHNNVA